MKRFEIAVIPGDGIGPEVLNGTRLVLDTVASRAGVEMRYTELLAGGIAIDATGDPLPDATVAACRRSDAVLLGAVGGPRWDTLPGDRRPERALLGLREALGLYANLRPARLYTALSGSSPLHPDISAQGMDVLFVRELTGGMYFGERGRRTGPNGPEAFDTECYSVAEIERVARVGFEAAAGRRGKLTSVDKANVLESSRLWRETVIALSREYPGVELDHLYVDNASMQLIRRPFDFDVIVTSNMFGDILSDEAAMITGSIGLLPSASVGLPGTPAMYEPIHGSAPDIAGRDVANPLASILSAAMMLRLSFQMDAEADAIELAVSKVLDAGYRTADILQGSGFSRAGTQEMSRLVAAHL